jgi:AcrR family transcriptional regulator
MLTVATELFAQKGYRAVSIRTIARRSGVTLSGLYYHFGDKKTLYVQAHLSEFQKSSRRLERALSASGGSQAQLLSFTTELCRVLSEPGPLFKLVARHWIEGDEDVIRSLARATVPVQFRQVVRAMREIVPPRQAQAMTMALYSLVHGLVTLRPFEDSLTQRPAVTRRSEPMAEFALSRLLPEINWKHVRVRLRHAQSAARTASDGSTI